MQLLTTLPESSNTQELVTLFHSSGIPIEISGCTTPYSDKVTVWVMIDSQLDEARLLLSHPSYTVKRPVDVEEFFREKAALQKDLDSQIYRLIRVAAVCGAIIGIALYFLRV